MSVDFIFSVVDWSVGANNINYITSRNHVPNVGGLVATFLDNLHVTGLIDFSRVSVVGKSLGGNLTLVRLATNNPKITNCLALVVTRCFVLFLAHVAGFVGKRVQRGRVDTIFGLDPAGPLFDANNPNGR